MRKIKIITSLVLVFAMALSFGACSKKDKEGGNEKVEEKYVEITMEDDRKIVIELLPEYAPMSVEFFLEFCIQVP